MNEFIRNISFVGKKTRVALQMGNEFYDDAFDSIVCISAETQNKFSW